VDIRKRLDSWIMGLEGGVPARTVAVQLRLYRRWFVGPQRLVGWCESCGFLAQAEPGQEAALLARLHRHELAAHSPPTSLRGAVPLSWLEAVVEERIPIPA
jgi:hypothetical protein